ncbi:MAG: enoyl-CoA hydratase-related protein [Actinomycetes bacterium]
MSDLVVANEGGVRTFTIQRPPVNALSTALLLELRAAVADVAADLSVRCLVITGAGDRFFVAGADVREAADTPPDRAWERTALGQAVTIELEALPVPVVAAINGMCIGGGCELAMAADIRIAADSATFAQPEIKLGIMPGFGGTQRLARLVGHGVAMDLLLSGRTIDAEQALANGLISRVVPANQLLGHAGQLALELADYAPYALEAIKRSVHGGSSLDLAAGLALEAEFSAKVRRTPDAISGLAAFRDKRVPTFGPRSATQP